MSGAQDMIEFEREDHFPKHLHDWLDYMTAHDVSRLPDLLADEAVFHSPVVHKPQAGKPIVVAYLSAADKVLGNDSFRYNQAIVEPGGSRAVLELSLIHI